MAKRNKKENIEEVEMVEAPAESLIEEVQDTVEEAVETVVETVEEVIEDVKEAVEEAVEAVEDAVEDVKEYVGKIFNKVDPATGPLPRAEEVVTIEAAPTASNKEHFDAGIQGAKAKATEMSRMDIEAAVVEAETKLAGSTNEVKDKTFNDTAVGGLVGTYKEDNRNGPVFYRGQ